MNQGWKPIDRIFTQAEARYIPNGPSSTTDMAHPTRTGDLVVFAYPPYQFDAATPGMLIAKSAFFGQHGYVPDVRILPRTPTCRATFSPAATRFRAVALGTCARSIWLRRSRTYAHLPRATARPGPPSCWSSSAAPVRVTPLSDHRPQRLPRSARSDNAAYGRHQRLGRGRPVGYILRRRGSSTCPATAVAVRRRQCRRPRRRIPALLEDIPAIEIENAWGWTPRRTAIMSSTTAWSGCWVSRSGRTSRSWRRTSSTRQPGVARLGDAVGDLHRQRRSSASSVPLSSRRRSW